jgi:cytidylate kinase
MGDKMQSDVLVVTVDGPSGSGKGTLSRRLSEHLGWHFLDSGALYRVLAYAALKQGILLTDINALSTLALQLNVIFAKEPAAIYLDKEDITFSIRTEKCGAAASMVAAIPEVREALLARQRAFRQKPGLVADGRDMGTVIFPDAFVKIFLEASIEVRAKRRQLQLKEQDIDVSLEDLLTEIAKRDKRDKERSVSPLHPAKDALILDTTTLSIDEVFAAILAKVKQHLSGTV